jgi:hypothetical protein
MTAADQLQASPSPFSLLHELPVLTEATFRHAMPIGGLVPKIVIPHCRPGCETRSNGLREEGACPD